MPTIDHKKLEAYADILYKRENQFNMFTLEVIGNRVKATGQLSAYDQQALKNIADISGDMSKITKELSRITEMNISDIEKIYTQVINDGIKEYKPLYDFKGLKIKSLLENDYLVKLVKHWAVLTSEKIINLSNTKVIGFTDAKGNFTDIQGAYQKTIDDAIIAITTGTIDFNSAMKEVIERLGGSGVVSNYGNGITRSIESMVRSNLLWGAKQAAQSYDDYVSEELGLDGFEVDAHSGCRPSHEFMQGKMYSYKGDKIISGVKYEDGSDALSALEDYGCLHFKTGVLLGVSEPRYSKEELDRIHKETTEKIEYNGKKKTLYEWKQTQRRLEREYRKARTQSDMFKKSGNNIAAKDFKQKADAIKSTYDDLTDKVPGLYDHSERMRTYFKGAKSLTSGGSGGIIEESTELSRKKGYTHRKTSEEGHKIVSDAEYNKIISKPVRQGLNVIRGDKYHEERLKRINKTASSIGDTIYLRSDCTVSDVLEEVYHFEQNRIGLNNDKEFVLRKLLNEIDAQKYLLSMSDKYKIPIEEIELTKINLQDYENQLKEYYRKVGLYDKR